jgi:hypothetical protein
MKRLLAPLLALAGVAGIAQAQPKVQMLNPKTILFTTPTISNDLAQLEPVHREPSSVDFVFHEDEWSQVEFFPRSQLGEVQRLLKDYKPFERAQRVQHGWREVYVRKVRRVPVLSGSDATHQLEVLLGAKAGTAPMLLSSGSVSGIVKNGFSLPIGGNVTLYGYRDAQGIPILGAIIGRNPDDTKLTKAFMKLNSDQGLILVDWRAQLVLVSVSPSGQIETWQP